MAQASLFPVHETKSDNTEGTLKDEQRHPYRFVLPAAHKEVRAGLSRWMTCSLKTTETVVIPRSIEEGSR